MRGLTARVFHNELKLLHKLAGDKERIYKTSIVYYGNWNYRMAVTEQRLILARRKFLNGFDMQEIKLSDITRIEITFGRILCYFRLFRKDDKYFKEIEQIKISEGEELISLLSKFTASKIVRQ